MLNSYMPKLINDLELGDAKLDRGTPGIYTMPFGDDLVVTLSSIDNNGFILKCSVAPFPTNDEEAFTNLVMKGNLFGKETHDAILGTTFDGNTLTLTQVVDYQVDYNSFKNILEDFLNAVDYWKELATTKQG